MDQGDDQGDDQGKAAELGRPVRAPDGVDCEPLDYSREQFDFLLAMAQYQKINRRRFPSYTEILAVAYSLGYRRVGPREMIPLLARRVQPDVPVFTPPDQPAKPASDNE